MILLEDSSTEQDALAGKAYIAVPLEIYQSASGETTLTVYSACRDIAHSYMSAQGQDPFEKKLITQVSQQIEAFMEHVGYKYDAEASQIILEYTAPKEWRMPKNTNNNVRIIRTLDEWMQYKNETNAEPDFLNDDRSVACAVVKNESIVSCACTNDAFYADDAAEVYVETVPEYQNQGFGTACAAALVSCLIKKEISVWYKCYENNSASAAIAEKCGLELKGERVCFVCYANV